MPRPATSARPRNGCKASPGRVLGCAHAVSTHAPYVLAWLAFRASGAGPGHRPSHIEAVVFDLDGVLIDSEQVWDEVRRELAAEQGRSWPEGASRDMMGMSSPEWSRYMHEVVGVTEPPEEISAEVVRRLEESYRKRLPLLPGAVDAVERTAARWPLGLASSSNRELIDLVLELSALGRHFAATVSSEEVERGKPAPDVYLETASRLRVDPGSCTAVEDSENGILSAKAAGMRVLGIPNPHFPPAAAALAAADDVLDSLEELTPERVEP